MSYIIYSGPTSVTGRRLREVMGIRGGIDDPGDRVEILLRWGSSERVRYKPAEAVINKRRAVELAADKIESLNVMREGHVPVPDIFMRGENIPAAAFPVLGRDRRHTQGLDIKLCLQRFDVERLRDEVDYFVAYVPTSREFRVHSFQGETLKVSEKILTSPEDYLPWVRNFGHGYTYRNVQAINDALMNRVEEVARRAVESLDLDFGAADVVLSDEGWPFVLEVNTGPSLSDNSLEVYVEKFSELLGIDEEDLNWDLLEEED